MQAHAEGDQGSGISSLALSLGSPEQGAASCSSCRGSPPRLLRGWAQHLGPEPSLPQWGD